MTNRVTSMEIRKAIEEVANTRSWKKVGKAMKLYGLCTAQGLVDLNQPVVR